MTHPPELSVVLPMYDEAPNVERILAAVAESLDRAGATWEAICVDDGSTDDTWSRLVAAAEADPRVTPLRLSRNFGKEAAMSAGLEAARGRAVLLLDADLQHPPALIGTLVQHWRDGADIVEAVKADRGRESSAYAAAAHAFYALMGASGQNIRGSSDFKLLDRQVVDVLNDMPERARFFRGLVAWVGYDVVRVPFEVAPRAAGTTSWSPFGLVRYAIRNLLAFSSTPLRMIGWTGLATLFAATALALQTLYNWGAGIAVTGFTTVILVQLGLGGLILASVGIVALYLAQIYDELKGRPTYVIRKPRPVTDPPSRGRGPPA